MQLHYEILGVITSTEEFEGQGDTIQPITARLGKKIKWYNLTKVKSFRGVVKDKAENKIRAQIIVSVKGRLKWQTRNMESF